MKRSDSKRPKRPIIKIEVYPEAKAQIQALSAKAGMKEVVLAGRVYTWFSQQDDVVQKAILGLLPAGLEVDVAKLALERIASGKAKAE